MKKFIALLIILFPVIVTAQSYRDANQIAITIDRPEGLPVAADTLLDEKISDFLPEDTPIEVTPDMSGSTQDPHNWEYRVDIDKLYEDDSILSLLMTTYQYTGGAHGSSGRRGIVIDKKTMKQLNITDIFQERPLVYRLGPLWRSQILARLYASNGSITASDRAWVREGTVDEFHYASFTLTDKYLTVYGQEYQHVAYAYGMQTLRVPLARIRDIMR